MRFTNLLKTISNKIFGFLDDYYYSYQEKINNNNLQQICEKRYFFIKPEVFLFVPFYEMFLYFHYWTYKQWILASIILYTVPITNHLLNSIQNKYEYSFSTNHRFLKNLQYPFLYTFIITKIGFSSLTPFQKISWISFQSFFYLLSLIHHVHQKRLDSYHLNNKNKSIVKEFSHPFDFCVVDSRQKTIEKILFYMQHLDKDTYYLYTSILLFFYM